MNLANKLTLLRIFLVIPFAVLLLEEGTVFLVASLIIFSIASLTDYYDGKIARLQNEVSDTGKLLDPLADKIFITAAFIIFVGKDSIYVPAWAVVLIIAREFIINGLRMHISLSRKAFAAQKIGKIKTVVQMTAIFLILIILIIGKFQAAVYYITIGTAIITVYSGFIYIKNEWSTLKKIN